MAGMVDIHCHILPGVDDGATSMEMALEMLGCGQAEGIEIAVLTPHLKPGDGPEKEALHQERFAALQEAVCRAGLAVDIHLGAEIGFRFGLEEVARWPSGSLPGGGCLALVDLPMGPVPSGLEQGFFALRIAGFKAILAHPERHRPLVRSPDQFERLRQQELLFQIDAGSLTGRFGSRAQQAAEMLLERGWVEFIASDGHDLDQRPFSLAGARARVEARFGVEEARRLFVDNPGRAIRGEAIEQRVEERPRPRRRSILQRLLGGKR